MAVSVASAEELWLSPLLFALVLLPLAATIRSSPLITGLKREGGAERISLYADNTLLYVGDTDTSLTHAMSVIQNFDSLSGFSIIWSKSVLLPLDDLMAPLLVGAQFLS